MVDKCTTYFSLVYTIQRQLICIHIPISGPITLQSPYITASKAWRRGRNSCGAMSVIIIYSMAKIPPPPMPCRERPAMTPFIVGDVALTREPRKNNPKPKNDCFPIHLHVSCNIHDLPAQSITISAK